MALPRKLTSKIYDIQAHSQKVTALDLGETGRVLVTGGQDRNVNLWAFGNEECFMSLAGHNGQVDCVKFASGDDIVYSADENGIIKRWDLNATPTDDTKCFTFYGHMKSVRTLDLHPHGDYFVASGSNDTTVRLWDVRKSDSCIEKYRGHIANVNSVKFSPDGCWVASAGTEGSVIIWDLRTRKKVIEFQEHASPVTCITFHPFEFLLAAGRNDGTVDLYDLEAIKLISRTDGNSPFNGHTVKCITFSENGECLFVGSAEGISVIGWEPDKEFDHIESAWSILGDMKIIKKRLMCGSYENQSVMVHSINLDHVIPFYNPTNIPFSHNHSSRKSFTRGNQKLKISISKQQDNTNGNSLTSGKETSSPSSFEMIDESIDEVPVPLPHSSRSNGNGYAFEKYAQNRQSYLDSLPANNYNKFNDGPQSTSETDEMYLDNYTNDLDYYPMKSSPDLSNVVEPEREDFPVNNAQQPDYAPRMSFHGNSTVSHKSHIKSKTISHKPSLAAHSVKSIASSRKLSNVTSISTMDLHNIDDSMSTTSMSSTKKSMASSRNGSPTRNYTAFNHNNNINKMKKMDMTRETIHARNNRKITVQIMAKPPPQVPPRSKTSFDLRAASASATMHSMPSSASSTSVSSGSGPMSQPRYSTAYASGGSAAEESSELNILNAYHEQVYHALSNRYATLQLIRNSVRSQDVMGALRTASKMQEHSILVDLLGAIIEKPATWSLDMCCLMLPSIYDLLQSDHKFHFSRACDTLRVIISNFLPVIQSSVGPWGSSYGGVDIKREERRNKCMECAHWLTRIRALPDNQHMGSNLPQLQKLIVDI